MKNPCQSSPSPRVRNRNVDVTGKRVVRAGCVVEFTGGANGANGSPLVAQRVRVDRVRDGSFWCLGWATPAFTPCCRVRVVSRNEGKAV